MKADQSGTWTQQVMYRMGYLVASQRPQCSSCKHHDFTLRMPDTDYESKVYRCKKGDFATAKTAICSEWVKHD